MKRNFTKALMLATVALSFNLGVANAQGAKGWGNMGIGEYPLVINENFQNWTKTHSVATQEIIGQGGAPSVSNAWQNGDVEIPVYNNDVQTSQKFWLTLVECAVAPDFYAQYTFDETKTDFPKDLISKGFIELGRISYDPKAPRDGELIIPEMDFIEGIQYSFASVGGSKRGFALYKSVAGGEWELVRNETGNANTSTSGTNMQESGYGQRFEELLYNDNVKLKFTISNSQIARFHDLKVYGTVGNRINSIENDLEDSFLIKNNKENVTVSLLADVQILSVSGAVIKSANAVQQLNIQDLPSGLYIVKATDVVSGIAKSKKIIK